MEWTKEKLSKLHNEIVLGSLFYNDYKNSFGIDEHACCDFFDAYNDYLGELMIEDGHDDDEYWGLVDQYDTDLNLWNWYNCYVDEPLVCQED